MFRKIDDFVNNFTFEMKATQAVLDALTDESLNQSINDDHRTIGRIGWHICETYPQMLNQLGLTLDDIKPPVPTSAKEIAATYARLSKTLIEFVKTNWQDTTLEQTDDLYGEVWARGKTLLIFIVHEVHHRGQITVLMRQADIVVPSIYGPAKEGWKEYGTEPPKV